MRILCSLLIPPTQKVIKFWLLNTDAGISYLFVLKAIVNPDCVNGLVIKNEHKKITTRITDEN